MDSTPRRSRRQPACQNDVGTQEQPRDCGHPDAALKGAPCKFCLSPSAPAPPRSRGGTVMPSVLLSEEDLWKKDAANELRPPTMTSSLRRSSALWTLLARACGGGHSYRYRFRAAPCAHVFKSASPLPSSPGPRAPRSRAPGFQAGLSAPPRRDLRASRQRMRVRSLPHNASPRRTRPHQSL